MYYTIVFYIVLAFLAVTIKDRDKAIKMCCWAIAIYTSLRYNYPSDYPAYAASFERYNQDGYVYDSYYEHSEIGWVFLNRLFGIFPHFVFVAFVSSLFAYAVYKILDLFASREHLYILVLGIVSVGGFTTLLSAERQLLVAAIFLLAYRYFLYNKVDKLRDLLRPNCIAYFLIIIGCHYFHKSALFLMIIPFFYLLPKASVWVILGIIITAGFLLLYGDAYLPMFFEDMVEDHGYYEYLKFNGDWSGEITLLQALMWMFLFINVCVVYKKFNYSKDEMVVMLIAMLAILITISGYSLGQVTRLAHYIYVFTFISIGIILQKYRGFKYFDVFLIVCILWVGWNLIKVFNTPRGTLFEYKSILSLLFT